MIKPSPRSTKAELLAAYQQLEASVSGGPTWQQVADKLLTTGRTIIQETTWLIKDCYKAGQTARRMYDDVVNQLRQPILKA